MKRPGPVGLTIFTVFGLVAIIELRTVLSMVGIDVSATTYYPAAVVVVALVVAGIYVLTDEEKGGPDKGNPSEA